MTHYHNVSARITLVIFLQLLVIPLFAQVTWPPDQLLPSFPKTAQTQDLIILREQSRSSRWEAEGPDLRHNTGRPEGDGWLCQVGIDEPNNHMIYGPYDTGLPAGDNIAEFRMKTDNNTANDDSIVVIDVRDNTTGQELASQVITRRQFPVASDYTTFSLPFAISEEGHAIEFRVYWRGGAYLKVDWIRATQGQSSGELPLFASLKGVVNKTEPRIFSYEGDQFAEGRYTWLQSLGLDWNEIADNWELITKYRDEIDGIIVYDDAQPHTMNLATTIAGDKKALVAAPGLVSRLTSAPYNLPILEDLRGRFSSKLAVYQTLLDDYWPNLTHRLLIGLSPEFHKAALREYATALGTAVVWLDPEKADESELLNRFLSSMPAETIYMGWWPEEGPGITRASSYGIATVPSDYATNLTVHGGMPRGINVKPTPPKPALQNKLYVAFNYSDGDNLQFVEHLMRKLWSNPDRGSVPIGWTVSPAMVDAMPGALNYLYQSATDNDNLISGPSGYGYVYPNFWPSQGSLDQFVAKTADYNQQAGLRITTIWNTIVGGIDQNVGESYADNAPTLLGVTAQNTGGGLTIYNNSLPGLALQCNYCTNEQAMIDHIGYGSEGWDGNSPRFMLIQAQPWQGITPTSFKNVANSLNDDYVVVRPDHLFQLLREHNGLPIDPGSDTTNNDNSGSIRIEAEAAAAQSGTQTENCSEGGRNVGWIDADDWMVWDVNLPSAGSYTVEYRVASPNGTGQLQLEKAGGSAVYGTLDVPNTGGWQNWTTIAHTVTLEVGQQQIAIKARSGGWNINWLNLRKAGSVSTTQKPSGDVASARVAAEIAIYPNPISRMLTVQGLTEKTPIKIYNLSGELIVNSTVDRGEGIDVGSFVPGVYLLKLATKSGPVMKRFIKQ